MSDTDKTTSKHVDEFTLLMYVERQLDRDAAQEVSIHTQTCTRCLTLLRALDRESRLLTRSMLEQDEELPARLAEFHARVKKSMQWIWGVIFGLAVLGAYGLYSFYIEPWELQLEKAGFGSSNLIGLLVFQGAFWKGWQSMVTLVEVVALFCLAGFGVLAVRKYLRRGPVLAVVVASLGIMMPAAQPACAQGVQIDMKNGPSLEIKRDEVRDKDLFFSGQRLRISGTVNGDVIAFAQQVEVSGHVNGDLILFAQSVRITGQVDGNIRSFTNNITISGDVARSVTSFAETFTVESPGKIERSLMTFSQTMTLDGKLSRDVRAFFNQGSIGGTIAGEFYGKGDALSIVSGAQIDGHAKFVGDKPADVSAEAKLASPLEYSKREHRHSTEYGLGFFVWRLIWASAFVIFGLVLFWLMPLFAREAAANVENVGASIGLGVLVGCALPIAAIFACITVVGLMVGISAFLVWLGCLYFSQIVVGAAVGQWILGRANETWGLVGRMAIGVVLLRIVMTVPIPHLSWLLKLAVILWGIGAISLTVYRRLQPVMAPNIPSVPVPPIANPLPPNTTVGGM